MHVSTCRVLYAVLKHLATLARPIPPSVQSDWSNRLVCPAFLQNPFHTDISSCMHHGACETTTCAAEEHCCGVVWCGVVWCDVVWCGVVWCTPRTGCVPCPTVFLEDKSCSKYSPTHGFHTLCHTLSKCGTHSTAVTSTWKIAWQQQPLDTLCHLRHILSHHVQQLLNINNVHKMQLPHPPTDTASWCSQAQHFSLPDTAYFLPGTVFFLPDTAFFLLRHSIFILSGTDLVKGLATSETALGPGFSQAGLYIHCCRKGQQCRLR